jgi:NAD-dependent DNA ligase
MDKSILLELLQNASEAYYGGTDLLLSDDQYDRLSDMVKHESVGAKLKDNTKRHVFPMYSLRKHYENEGGLPPPLDKFENTPHLIKTPKLDGAAIELTYLNGMFAYATTRGDGDVGQLISEKVGSIKNIPPLNTVPFKGQNIVQVSGEVVVAKEVSNSRNYVSGALALKSLDEFNSRDDDLFFYAYSVQPALTDTYFNDLYQLHVLGFETVITVDESKYRTDGIVLRINNNKYFNSLGCTAHHPRGAVAVKKRKSGVFTTLKDVVWQIGKSGRVTPVAILDPVVIDDATISKATLNNVAFIKALDLHIGDEVEVVRSGDIIPCIVSKR